MKPIYRWMLSVSLFGSGALTGLALATGQSSAASAAPAAAASAAPAAAASGDPTAAASGDPTAKVTFDNPRVTVKEIILAPGISRPTRTRETDELVLFPGEAHYLAVTPEGKKERRDRQPGTVVWHKKGEVAPTLVNDGNKPVRYFSVSIK